MSLRLSVLSAAFASFATLGLHSAPAEPPPNVLFIIADDLNTAIGAMGGHAITPNLDRLARQGVVFQNAACNYPVCQPSRASMIYGIYPHTGLFFDVKSPLFYQGPFVRQRLNSYIDFFKKSNYAVYGTGKIYHNLTAPEGTWYDDAGNSIYSVPPNWGPYPGDEAMPSVKPTPAQRQYFAQGEFKQMEGMWELTSLASTPFTYHPKFPRNFNPGVSYASLDEIPTGNGSDGWYLYDKPYRYVSESDRDPLPDELSVKYVNGLMEKGFDRPFFISVGLVRTHTPLYVPKKYYDLYPLDSVKPPEGIKAGDISQIAADLGRNRALPKTPYRNHGFFEYDLLKNYKDGEGLREFYRAYLATISFVDAQVGELLDALERSPYAKNTLIVFTSDNGYHIGEKEQVFKGTVWEESARVPLIIAGPGIAQNAKVTKPVGLIDLYPTFLDYARLTEHPHGEFGGPKLDGFSLKPLLENPRGNWNGPDVNLTALGTDANHEFTSFPDKWEQHYAVRSERYRYIRTASGEEELYDYQTDPYGWNNIAQDPLAKRVKEELHGKMKALISSSEPLDITKFWQRP